MSKGKLFLFSSSRIKSVVTLILFNLFVIFMKSLFCGCISNVIYITEIDSLGIINLKEPDVRKRHIMIPSSSEPICKVDFCL